MLQRWMLGSCEGNSNEIQDVKNAGMIKTSDGVLLVFTSIRLHGVKM